MHYLYSHSECFISFIKKMLKVELLGVKTELDLQQVY